MELIIHPQIFQSYPDLSLGVIFVKDINNQGDDAGINKLLREAENNIPQKFANLEAPSKHLKILAWRKAYKKFGSDPHEYRSSIEALVRRVLKGGKIQHINKLVDLYNYISLKYLVPVGGEDVDTIKGDVLLNFANGDERFIRLGGTENEPPKAGEVIYKDDIGVLCRRWNWREAERTKLTEKTTSAILVIEGLAPTSKESITTAIKDLADLIQKYCDGEINCKIISMNDSVLLAQGHSFRS